MSVNDWDFYICGMSIGAGVLISGSGISLLLISGVEIGMDLSNGDFIGGGFDWV